ncbi:MAG TPA: hypothetical protein VFZ27_09210 [Terriglobia bacterium]|nr:hypothetical protein [Terriglobia bacterium]
MPSLPGSPEPFLDPVTRHRNIVLFFSASECGADFGFGIDAERVGHTIDVIEIGDDFNSVQDVAVAEAVFAKRVNVPLANGGGSARDKFGESGQGFAAGRKPGVPIVLFNAFGQVCVAAFRTEILSVSFDSIKAVIGCGDDHGQQFAFSA